MFELFGEFNSAEELNETAVNLRKEGDTGSILTLAEENGIDKDIAEAFIDGDILYLADAMSAAIGKIDMEAAVLQPKEIMADWVEYIKTRCFEDAAMAAAVRKRGKTLKGCIGALLKWSFESAEDVDTEVVKAAGISAKVKLGIPGMGRAKKLITEYYMGK